MDRSFFHTYQRQILSIFKSLLFCFVVLFASSAQAITIYDLANHPAGGARPPTYGMRLDEIVDLTLNVHDIFTFDFDNAASSMRLEYDDIAGTIRIFGTVFGGLDTGVAYDPTASGLWDVDFTYRQNITSIPGNLTVNPENANNNGTITPLFNIGSVLANTAIALVDEDGGKGFSFQLDNGDHRLSGTPLFGDPTLFVGWGWLNHSGLPHVAASDWLFTARVVPEPGSMLLLGSAILGASRLRRKKMAN